MRAFLVVAAWVVCAACAWGQKEHPLSMDRPDPARFASEIEEFAAQEPETGGIVFTGSSSIRLWTRLREDFPDLPVVNRGFGGCVANDMITYFDTLVSRHQPKLLVVYVGTNDLHVPLTVDETFADYRKFLGMVRERLPETRVIINSLKICRSRFSQTDQVFELNKRLQEFAATDDMLRYLDSSSYLMDAEGRPVDSLFRSDQLHLSPVGYAHWLILLDPVVREEWAKVHKERTKETAATP